MTTLTTTLALPPDPPAVSVNVAGVAAIYAAACAFEPADMQALEGLGDLHRVSVLTTVGSVRRLVEALAIVRSAS